MQKQPNPAAWYHHGYAWLAFGGPALVVVASFVTTYIAFSHRDVVIEDAYNKGIHINQTMLDEKNTREKTLHVQTAAEKNALAPAMLARNHAATGVNQD